MPILDANDPRKVPERPTVTSFCDTCHALTRVTQVKTIRGVQWLCENCSPAVTYVRATPHSPPPSDPAPSPEIEQWLPEPPADLDDDISLDQMLESMDHAAESEPIAAEQAATPHEEDR